MIIFKHIEINDKRFSQIDNPTNKPIEYLRIIMLKMMYMQNLPKRTKTHFSCRIYLIMKTCREKIVLSLAVEVVEAQKVLAFSNYRVKSRIKNGGNGG